MSGVLDLVRPDLRDFAGYRSARSERVDGDIWLNANESARANAADAAGVYRRYPEPQPDVLRNRLAALYGCLPTQLLAGRGSDEAIDLLVRAFCVPGDGAIVTTPPTFGMYGVCARLHGVGVVESPLVECDGAFAGAFEAIAEAAEAANARLVFLCSPGNPPARPATRCHHLARPSPRAPVRDRRGRGLPGVRTGAVRAVPARRASEHRRAAHAVEGACAGGCPLGRGGRRRVAGRRATTLPGPVPAADAVHRRRASRTRRRGARGHARSRRLHDRERMRLASALATVPGVRQVYRSDANFLLVRFGTMPAPRSTHCWRPAWWCATCARRPGWATRCASRWVRPRRTNACSMRLSESRHEPAHPVRRSRRHAHRRAADSRSTASPSCASSRA